MRIESNANFLSRFQNKAPHHHLLYCQHLNKSSSSALSNLWLLLVLLILLKIKCVFSCQVQRCGDLSAPEHGWISPWFCSSERPVYGSSCKVGCHIGFRVISGVDQFFCGSNGQWSNDTNKILQCEGKLQLRTDEARLSNNQRKLRKLV